jgi:NAD(P)-dependent dehydrogenase (short-subunit alcohol dehydrogenase family)
MDTPTASTESALDLMRLDGRVVLVTGGAGGIGAALARGVADAGAAVVVTDINVPGAISVATELERDGFRAIALELDVSNLDSAKSAMSAAAEQLGGVDVLINNAAVLPRLPRVTLMESTLELFDEYMHANCWGLIACTQAAVPLMLKRGGGSIINIGSTGAFGGNPGSGTVYRVSKYAMVSVTDCLARVLGPQGITVNTIAPGLVHTPGSDAAVGAPGSERRMALLSKVPLANPDREAIDLVGAVLLLASRAGSYINGQTIVIDGGENTRL